ncbi:AbrB/MazE/SpoVT family DNA-binding domain-containing protein [Membranicola marinus]|uniref:AbrB/MazE/SpoVT family DNA-binding domain-containing protein n=1 Tax=Membranihabitans marinus TaxID=1227546 RepID=A0A953HMW9_9BACT|nr:AbrB/MazE/SpoVT family DNA-binding domain-containing protein [Membranihabitans marinus]MBY5958039.1 AbrB/MazE/SpoVT family DNA-binding domain-containing protein [Membranihabitans marinus]
MEANIIKIGNSKGIIIPANIIRLLGLEESVQMELENEKLILTPGKKLDKKKKPREGWEEALRSEIEKNGQPERLLPDFFEDEDLSEWTW